METIAKTQVYNLVILDKSGSMESIRKEAIDGYNETLGTIRAAQTKHGDTQEQFVSLAAFCGCGIEMIYDKTPIDKAEKLTREKYEPCCVTPLFDAIGSSIKKLKNDIKDIEDAAVLVTIITDGYENASRRYNYETVRKMVEKERDKYGWEFIFLGANMDAIETAGRFGIHADRAATYNVDEKGVELNYKVLSETVACMRTSAAPVGAKWKEAIERDKKTRRQGR